MCNRRGLPESIRDVDHLEDLMSTPSDGVIETLGRLDGDIIVLGAGGKMGPSLSRMARRASDAAGVKRRVIAVSRFSSEESVSMLQSHGVETVRADLLNEKELKSLPDTQNVVFMVGMKFGSSQQQALTWAMNAYLPGLVCQRYAKSRMVAFSSGNVYGMTPVCRGGSIESDSLNPVGEYAMSVLARERVFEHFSLSCGIPTALIRLNYSVEMRYGVLVDLAIKVFEGQPVDVTMGNANLIWQADANAMTLQSFDHVSSPPFVLNVTGPEMVSIRQAAQDFAEIMGKPLTITGTECQEALIGNAQLCHSLFGYPKVPVRQMIRWIADWVARGGESLGKPTHYEVSDGKY